MEEFEDIMKEKGAFSVSLRIDSRIKKDTNHFSVSMTTTLRSIKSKEIDLIKHTGETNFLLSNLEGFFVKEKDAFDLPEDLLVQLYGISYSHCRALLSSELKNTSYNNLYILPIIDPKQLLVKTKL